MNRQSHQSVRRIKARNRRLLEHVARYRLTTVEALCRVVIPGLSANAVSKTVNRICDSGLLKKFTLIHPTRYYILSEAGAKALGVGIHRCAPLGPQSLPMEYAVLAYATLGKEGRQRLTLEEVQHLCPWLPTPLAQAHHCFDERQQVLELVRTDLGGPADHVARKSFADLTARRRIPEFNQLIQANRFRLVVITATKEKSSAIKRSLDRHDWPAGLALHLPVVPQLLSLTARLHHA
ncbi:MAG: hypothetical protein R3C18_02805 [Planctomycetaceae bacterium]